MRFFAGEKFDGGYAVMCFYFYIAIAYFVYHCGEIKSIERGLATQSYRRLIFLWSE